MMEERRRRRQASKLYEALPKTIELKQNMGGCLSEQSGADEEWTKILSERSSLNLIEEQEKRADAVGAKIRSPKYERGLLA